MQNILYTRPANTNCTGSITEEEIYIQFDFLIGRIIDVSDIFCTGHKKRTLQFPFSYRVHFSVQNLEGI